MKKMRGVSLIKFANKKVLAIVGAVVVVLLLGLWFQRSRCCGSVSYPQGGMWMPDQMTQNQDALKALGLSFPIAGIASPDQEPLAASVSLGGCSASFISPHGLIITNHHCVVGILNNLSKDGTDYQVEGFLAKSMADEKPAPPTQKAFVMLANEDVTETIREGLELIPEPIVRTETVDRRIDELIRARELSEKAKDASIQVEVKGYFRDSKFYLTVKKQIRDVRLVYAPHEGIGFFGGDIDNWHWPRHTGDFALLRAYVSKDGASAPFSPTNVPYQSPHYLRMPSEPLKAGDLVFVMGYPGATERWETADEVRKEMSIHYPHQIARSRGMIAVLENFEKSTNAQSARVAKGMLPRLRNYLPLWEGELQGMKDIHLLRDKQKEQENLSQWIEQKPERHEKYAVALNSSEPTEAAVQDAKEAEKIKDRSLKEFLYWGFQSRPPPHLLRVAMLIARMAEERQKKDIDRRPEFKEREWENIRNSIGQTYQDQIDAEVEKAVLAYYLELARTAGNDALLEVVVGERNPFEKAVRAKLDAVYQGTGLLNLKTRMDLFNLATPKQLTASTDPAIRIALGLLDQWKKFQEREDEERGKDLLDMALWAEARMQFLGTPEAPDANASQRITFGTVRNYCKSFFSSPYPTFTYVSEVQKKTNGTRPFNTPEKLLERAKRKEFGTYAASETGEVPVGFLSDLDITGGNSGSPVINRKGELVGVAFDGVAEAMVSDKKFLPAFSRTIAVDTRYFLWVLDAVESSKWLLEELGQKPQFAH